MHIEITTYVSPHLIWVIENSENRWKQLKSLKHDLDKTVKDDLDAEANFEVGQFVAVHIHKNFYRATIENIYSDFEADTECWYQCWLVDYGTMVEANKVYKLPISLKKLPPLSFQVCLNNITYITEKFEIDMEGQPVIRKMSTTIPSPRSRQISLEILSSLTELKLQLDYEENGIIYGDIIGLKNETVVSLKSELNKLEIIDINEDLFEGVKNTISSYKEDHLRLIGSISKNSTVSLDYEKVNSIESNLQEIKRKILMEFGDNEDLMEQNAALCPLSNRRSGPRSVTSSSSEPLNSSTDLNSTMESEKSSGNISRHEKLMNFLRRKAKPKDKETNETDEEESNKEKQAAIIHNPKNIMKKTSK